MHTVNKSCKFRTWDIAFIFCEWKPIFDGVVGVGIAVAAFVFLYNFGFLYRSFIIIIFLGDSSRHE